MAPSIDRPTYDIVTFLHRRFRHFFTPGGGQPVVIPRAEFADFVDEVSLSIQFLHSAVTSKTLPVIAIRVYHECVQTLLISFSTNQVPVPDWCPGWLNLDKTAHVRSHWDPSTDLPRSPNNSVAAPPAVQQQDPPSTQPPPYSVTQNPTPPTNPPLVASPSGFGLPQATRVLRSGTSTPKNQTFGQPSTLLRNIAGTPINTVNPSTPSSSRTARPAQNFSAPPISTLSTGTSPTSSMRQGSSPFLAPKRTTSTSTFQNPISGLSPRMVTPPLPVTVQDDELVSSSPERPLADLVGKPAAKRPVPNPIRPGTFAPFGKQRKPPLKPPVARPPRSPTPEPAPQTTPEPSTSKAQGKKRARSESDFEDKPDSDDPLLEPQTTQILHLPPREHSSPETRQRRQDQPFTETAGSSRTDVRLIKKPKLVEETSEDNADVEGSHDENSEHEPEPEPKSSKANSTKKKPGKKRSTAKPTSPAVRRQQQERYRNAAFPGLAWSADLKLPVIDNAEAFKNFETSLVQITPVPQSRTSESRTFRASKIDIPNGFILSSELPGFISIDVLKRMNFSAHTNCLACCTCISQTMTKECEGRGPGEKCVNCRTGSCSTHGGFIRQELASMASSRHVLESSPLIVSQLNRLLSMQQNMETEAQAMMQRINHFDREVVVLQGMMRDVPRVLWQIEQANPDFEWTDEFLLKLAEIAGWTIAPTVEEAMEYARHPTTGMMRRFHPIYPDTANVGCSRSADEVAYEAGGMQLRYPDEGADSASQAPGSPSSR
ncbi:hypothetical protein K435DRAFT_862446 [Dendrothele bispora CBS 962.96]|uniref:Uncharacterized protein n=1 Tax=Dendrothele bispora (strain CBS 962.96) TaxID=1314807 RepID=A0A4S8LSL2_DENBC|nr:hypothetical protein K435DRAFT_862446 [Dendrothele bispora CBS 962.96]